MAKDIAHECRAKNYTRLPNLLELLRYQIKPEDIGETDDSIRAHEFMAMTVKAKKLLSVFRTVPEGTGHDQPRKIAWLMFYQYALAMQDRSKGWRESPQDFFATLGMDEAERKKFQGPSLVD